MRTLFRSCLYGYCRLLAAVTFVVVCLVDAQAQGVVFNRDFCPQEGLTAPSEHPLRDELCLNGYWQVQCVDVPSDWQGGRGEAPDLPPAADDAWDEVRLKVPSAVNVNFWGNGLHTGEGTDAPYRPSSVYFPSYPEHWAHARMAWLRKTFSVPDEWESQRVLLHFEAVAGDCVVLLNGQEVGHNFDCFLPFEIDITPWLNLMGENELLVGVRHPRLFEKTTEGYSWLSATYPTGSTTEELMGIWQDVYLLAVPAVRISNVFVQPLVSKQQLAVSVTLTNDSHRKQAVRLSGAVSEWINLAGNDILTAPEPQSTLGREVLVTTGPKVTLLPGETKTVELSEPVHGQLQLWSPDAPHLYSLLLRLDKGRTPVDVKATRFGWREFTIVGDRFHLNGEPIQCFGDLQHPFSAYVCSRRFAYAWYRMIKDAGGNAVRPHAQPWPRFYYDLADEMGLLVLDETGVFGSNVRQNFAEAITWERYYDHLRRLVLRDRNHPSVVGWSAGNETNSIAFFQPQEKKDSLTLAWNDQLAVYASSIQRYDTTRTFITFDGDFDVSGHMPVWSRHFAHGLHLEDLPQGLGKPLVVGENGATYYGRPDQLFPFSGEEAYRSYYGHNEALAVDIYQNVRQMALPYLAWFSPSELCWFGLEHQPLGYSDYNRLPCLTDGIFPGKPYEEGKPGYQYERIPPYVSTFNPGLDPSLPLYQPLPMFYAYKAALAGEPWEPCRDLQQREKPVLPAPVHMAAYVPASARDSLHVFLENEGICTVSDLRQTSLFIIDGATATADELVAISRQCAHRRTEPLIIVMAADGTFSSDMRAWLPASVDVLPRDARQMENDTTSAWGHYFQLPDLYFADRQEYIVNHVMDGPLVEQSEVVLRAGRTDWSLFNWKPEEHKCAQVVLYEHLAKAEGAVLLRSQLADATLVVSTIDYRQWSFEAARLWNYLCALMGIHADSRQTEQARQRREHNLLLDGPVDQ